MLIACAGLALLLLCLALTVEVHHYWLGYTSVSVAVAVYTAAATAIPPRQYCCRAYQLHTAQLFLCAYDVCMPGLLECADCHTLSKHCCVPDARTDHRY
jgi:hypothetical protein